MSETLTQESSFPAFPFFFFFFLRFYLFIHERERERESETQAEEKQAPCREPNVGLDPGSPGSPINPIQIIMRFILIDLNLEEEGLQE